MTCRIVHAVDLRATAAFLLVAGLGMIGSLAVPAHAEPPAAANAPDQTTDAAKPARTPEAILKEFDEFEVPEPAFGTPEAQQAAQIKRAQGLTHLNNLALEFYRVAPEHERAGPLLYTRWNNMFPVDGGHQRVFDETTLVIKENKTPACVTEALFWNTIATGSLNPQGHETTIAAIDRFVAHAPKDERGALMMMSLANRLSRSDTARSTVLMRRVVQLYPESERAEIARGWLRVIDGLNKPFELAFTDAISGEKVDVQKLKGKVVIIDFWATWCKPCIAEMPKLLSLYEELKGEIEIVAVSLDNPESEGGLTKLKKMVSENGYGWKHYYQGKGWESEFSKQWGVTSIPRVFVVDHNGLLVDTNARGVLEKLVRDLVAAKKSG